MIIPALKKTYAGRLVLELPELMIRDGSILAVCGQNGSGKTTFARILAGIIQDDEGNAKTLSVKAGYLSQHPLAFKLSVRKNLLINAEKNCSGQENEQRAEQLLEAVGLMEDGKKRADRLSGGQIQRMALARILMKKYELLILDEPTASMDQQMIPAAEQLLKKYQDQTGCTVILITHSPEQAARIADTMIVLEEGRLKSSDC